MTCRKAGRNESQHLPARKTLHVHPQYARIGEKVIYDFAVNIEKSDLKYRDASKRKFLAVVGGYGCQRQNDPHERGTTGGDKFTSNCRASPTRHRSGSAPTRS